MHLRHVARPTGRVPTGVSARSLLLAVALVLLLSCSLAGCGDNGGEPALLESERQLEGMYEACKTIDITDELGEHPPITFEELPEMESVEVSTTLKRSNGMEMPGTWTGVPLSTLLSKHGVPMPFRELRIEAWDGYIGRLGYDVASLPDTILAYLENGEDIPEVDGPMRLVVGSQEGYYWVRMITEIEVVR